MSSESDVPLYFYDLTYRERKLNCPVSDQMNFTLTGWMLNCYLLPRDSNASTTRLTTPHLKTNSPMGPQIGGTVYSLLAQCGRCA